MPSTGAGSKSIAEALHAEVGGDDDAGEVAGLRDAGDGDRLRAKCLGQHLSTSAAL